MISTKKVSPFICLSQMAQKTLFFFIIIYDNVYFAYQIIYQLIIIQHMDSPIPILTIQQIEQLKTMISSLIEDNNNKLDTVLSSRIDLQNATILNLYNLVMEQWHNKQKIVDNVCHFALSMMASIQFLWDQKYQQEQERKIHEAVVSNLQKYVQELTEENQTYKNKVFQVEYKINQAQSQIQSINHQKQKIQDFYKSYSCGDLSILSKHQQQPLNIIKKPPPSKRLCQSCLQIQSNYNQLSKHLSQKIQKLCQATQQIQYLKQQNKSLQDRYDNMIEQYNLMKMQIQLAEMAIKDVSQRALSLNNSSIFHKYDDVYDGGNQFYNAGRSYDLNGQIQNISNFNDSFISQRNINNSRISINSNQVNISVVQSNKSLKQNDKLSDKSKDGLNDRPNDKLGDRDDFNYENVNKIAFKKKNNDKMNNIRMQTQPNLEHKISFQTQPSSFQKSVLKTYQYQKTVTIQCDLLKNVPKIQFFVKQKNDPKKKSQNVAKKGMTSQIKVQKIQNQPKKIQKIQKISKSQILPQKVPIISKNQPKQPLEKNQTVGPLHNFFTFFSNKVITNRIKTK